MKQTIVVAVAGGSCSGKTRLVAMLTESIGHSRCSILYQDDYYCDGLGDPTKVNFDHPDALDFSLMAKHLGILKQRQGIEVPIYDFVTHSRKLETNKMLATDLIFIEGILVLDSNLLREHINYSIYVRCPEEVRYQRRVARDTLSRGRTPKDIERQFYTQVAPMHDEFVEPSSRFADLVIEDSRAGMFDKDVDKILQRCQNLIE